MNGKTTKEDLIFASRLWLFALLTLLFITQCNYHNDTIAAVRAVGVQCTAEYRIEIPTNDTLTEDN